MRAYRDKLAELDHLKSIAEVEEVSAAVGVILHGSNESVMQLDTAQCAAAVERLSARAIEAIASEDGVRQRITQHQLATALLRWSQIAARAGDAQPQWRDAEAAAGLLARPPKGGAFRH